MASGELFFTRQDSEERFGNMPRPVKFELKALEVESCCRSLQIRREGLPDEGNDS